MKDWHINRLDTSSYYFGTNFTSQFFLCKGWTAEAESKQNHVKYVNRFAHFFETRRLQDTKKHEVRHESYQRFENICCL